MRELLGGNLFFSIFLTLGAYCAGLMCQRRWKSALLNPILIGTCIVIFISVLFQIPNNVYQQGCQPLSFLLTPATICLSISFYEQLRHVKKYLPIIFLGVLGGTLCSMGSIALLAKVFGLEEALFYSLLPKSVTTAIGVALCEEADGIVAVTTAAIVATGILGNIFGPALCRLFRLRDPIAQGAAFGTASHVIGTAKANELGSLAGAVSGISLTLAGLLTAVFYSVILAAL